MNKTTEILKAYKLFIADITYFPIYHILVLCTGSFCSQCATDEDCRKTPDTANHQCFQNVCRRCIADSHCPKGFKCRAGNCIIPRS